MASILTCMDNYRGKNALLAIALHFSLRMRRGALNRSRLSRLAWMALVLPLSACSLSSGFLMAPAGPVAQAERHEFLIVCIILCFVVAPVFLLLPLIAWHYRIANTKAAFRPQWGFSWGLEALIWLPPSFIVVLLSVFLLHYTVKLDPYRLLPGNGAAPLEVDVVALDWKWLFFYPAQHVATVNQLIVPAGQPVVFYLTSGTVMQSLLMPRIAGQIFAMNGMRTKLNFEISQPGTFYGENTQYNGDGFAEDKFSISALSEADFMNWVAKAQTNPAAFDAAAYQKLSTQSVLTKPLEFGRFAPDLFSRILAQQITPGYLIQHHEVPNG